MRWEWPLLERRTHLLRNARSQRQKNVAKPVHRAARRRHRFRSSQGFAAFGRVTRGMDVVKRIQVAPVSRTSQNLAPPVQITSAKRVVRQ